MFKLCWHCWHHVEGSTRKLKRYNYKRCTSTSYNSYICGDHIKCIAKKQCCKCKKIEETTICRSYQIDRALKYPDYGEK